MRRILIFLGIVFVSAFYVATTMDPGDPGGKTGAAQDNLEASIGTK